MWLKIEWSQTKYIIQAWAALKIQTIYPTKESLEAIHELELKIYWRALFMIQEPKLNEI